MAEIALAHIGAKFLKHQIEALTSSVEELSPSEFNEAHRFLPRSSSPKPGPFKLRWTPYWKEPLDNQDPRSPVRETIVKKGIQVGYNVGLIESAMLFMAAFLKTESCIFASLDKEMASERIETNILPMFNDSGFESIFQSTDLKSSHKTGKTKNHLQWLGGGFMLVYGATNINKIRSFGVPLLYLDEIDAEQWEGKVSGGGDKVGLFKKRCRAYWTKRKIIVGSSPLLDGSSRIQLEFLRGDQRIYKNRCIKCGYPQGLRWTGTNDGRKYGFSWDYTADGQLDNDSVRYECKNCGHAHLEHDKPKFINLETSYWEPTAIPKDRDIRSYHVPSFLSLVSPWHEAVSDWLSAIDHKTGKVIDVGALQGFYNNHLGEPFKLIGGKVSFESVSQHRRAFYRRGEIMNKKIKPISGSDVLFLTMSVDVHEHTLFVGIFGWTSNFSAWIIEYIKIHDDSAQGCNVLESPAWNELAKLIEDKEWTADDGKKYRPILTFVDSGFNASVVTDFCGQWESGVIPIIGRDRPAKAAKIEGYSTFETRSHTTGIRIVVDHYKDRLAPVLRRVWHESEGVQMKYTVNAPVDMTDEELRELTREIRREKKMPDGTKTYYWHRPNKAPNELWDLLVYSNAAVEFIADSLSADAELDATDWTDFWAYCKDGAFFTC